ncbi:MAG TPA: zf-TFIIB domain-containing protein [bacterium]
MKEEPAHCPNCSIPMQGVSTSTALEKQLRLDQCGRCGGIWFDKWELFAVDPEKIDGIDDFDLNKLNAPLEINSVQKCPRCSRQLNQFRDPVLPSEVLIFRCNLCNGIFLNCGELKKYKNFRKKKTAETPLTDKHINSLILSIIGPQTISIKQNSVRRSILGTLLRCVFKMR